MRDLLHSGQFKGMRAVVLGAGLTGLAAARLLAFLGARVRLLDRNESSVDDEARRDLESRGVSVELGEHDAEQFSGVDMVILSPGVPRRKVEGLLAGVAPGKIMSELELASWFVEEAVVAITGTNGKTTTTALVAHTLEQNGRRVFAGANFGTPLSEYILSTASDAPDAQPKADVLVLEVSSFQLQNCISFRPNIGVLLNFSANHLDYHETMEEYLDAKLKLFARQKPGDLAIVPLEMKEMLEAREFTHASRTYFVPTNRFPDSPLIGLHNQANVEAAYLAVRPFGVTEEKMAAALSTFKALPHRIERVDEKGGVLFVDDSKSTTIDSLRAALTAFDKPVLLLAGGVFKGGNLKDLLPVMRGRVKSVGLFGKSREIFEAAWAGEMDLSWSPTLEEAVRVLVSKADPGDVVLLSPATASFDLYSGYKARGDDFKRIVRELP